MTDKLYSEAAVQNIADAIREKTGTADTYTVSQMGDAVRGISTGVDTADATASAIDILYGKTAYVDGTKVDGACRYKEYSGEIVSTVVGVSTYVELVEDALLAEIRDIETLFITLELDIEPTAYTVKRTYAFNRSSMLVGWTGDDPCQYVHRYGADSTSSSQTIAFPINDTESSGGIGRIIITEDGKMLCTANSNNYALRPANYTIKVVW